MHSFLKVYSPHRVRFYMITILHTIDTTGPGGAETVFIDLATRLPADKYRSVVVIRGKGWVYEELCRRGVEPILLDAKGSLNWRYLWRLCRLIRREHVDIIQSHLLGSNVYCALAGLLTRRPVVATFHGAVDIGQGERFLKLKFGAINLGARHVIAVSNSLRGDLCQRTPLKPALIRVIYNGIDTTQFDRPPSDALRGHYGWDKKDLVVGSLGNIRPAKGYDILLQAAALLKDSPVTFRFAIAGQGKGGLYDRLLQQRAELGIEKHVQFVGFVANPAEFLSNLDMFLLTSTTEGFSIATIQAMASGLPVVVTRSGGPQEIVSHAENGWMVESGNPQAIAEGIARLATDPELRAKLATNGKVRAVSTYGLEAMLSAYQAYYTAVLAN